MDAKTYLERIKYSDSLLPSFETLRDLQIAHLLSVPFENLDIHTGRQIILKEDLLFDKIVTRGRGGFCYELNGLFAALLRELGFSVTLLTAGVAKPTGGFGPDFDHMALMITLENKWLVDVGFGDSSREPLLIDLRDVQSNGGRLFKIREEGKYYLLSESGNGIEWKDQYRFTLRPCELQDYTEMCRYHQTSPASIFTQRKLCSIAKPDGRLTLSDMHLIDTSGNERIERIVKDEAEYNEILGKEFGIVL